MSPGQLCRGRGGPLAVRVRGPVEHDPARLRPLTVPGERRRSGCDLMVLCWTGAAAPRGDGSRKAKRLRDLPWLCLRAELNCPSAPWLRSRGERS